MKYRISAWIVAALLAPVLDAQRLPTTYSGPFWRHVVQDFTTTATSGCSLTVNGGSVPIPGGLTLDGSPAQAIKFVAQCSFPTGLASQRFEGTLTPNMPSAAPIATRSSFDWQLPAPGMKTSMIV